MATTISDDFNRAASGIGANWAATDSQLRTDGAKAFNNSSGVRVAIYTTALDSTDMAVSHKLGATTTGGNIIIARAASASASADHYELLITHASGVYSARIRKSVGGVYTDLSSTVTISAVVVGDVYELACNASSLVGSINGVSVVSVTDTSLTGTHAGFGLSAVNTAADDFAASVTNFSPTANAGTDKTVVAGGTVVVGGTDTDPDGTIASRSWRIVSGGGSLSSTTVASPTFTAPSTPGPTVLGKTVTDNTGSSSTEDTVTVDVYLPLSAYLRIDGAWEWKPVKIRQSGAWI